MQPSIHGTKKSCIEVLCKLCVKNCDLTKKEYKKFNALKKECITLYDQNNYEHERILNEILENSLDKTSWKKLGFQSENPRTDFRAGGFYALKFIHYFSIFHTEVIKNLFRNFYK
jgi:hypothetical protein